MHNLTATALFSLLATAATPASCNSSDAATGRPIVQLAGGTVTGTIDPSTPSVRQFLGIPYAQPPLGPLRFSPPQRPTSPLGDVDATAMPPSCMQHLSSDAGFYTREVLEFNLRGLNVTGPVSEDCLTVSVWTPESAGAGADLPVLIYVYGGGFQTGGVDVPYQLPPRWVERTRSHVVVVMNYRLNIFGFPSAAGLDATGQNLGLLDQRLAVEWARDNVAAFGGDPKRMGLWGQSAGSMSVGAYAFAYAEDPIVNSFMMNSATELSNNFTQPLHSNFTFVAGRVGCGGLKAAEELECMRKVPAGEIASLLKEYADSGSTPGYRFWPVVDDKFVFGDYGKLYREGKVARIPAIIGSNAQDGNPFAPYNPDGVDQTAADAAKLSLFFCPAFKTSLNRIRANVPTFRYEYFGNFSNVSPKPWMGAYHSGELPMLFGTHGDFRGESTQLECDTSAVMQDAWLALVRDGVAGVEALGWPVYGGNVVQQFGNGVASRSGDAKEWEARC
ncbi:hypothetical protein PpBr36_02021 [Pyricularia pennisetigena]|uniref:hypothetical protein n=1 Tax=Pyricularia pennisetigena TaxID=1578925 RepID=UPI00114EDE13|nr:hypothetical protein PpBr36_02021 [Pyricularia pennisetigena]TLS28031.1 hypothetical protein PpBr36_02021 [Pyricularia pennisetigena]